MLPVIYAVSWFFHRYIWLLPNISDIAAPVLFTAFKEFQESQQIRVFFSHQRHKRALTASTEIDTIPTAINEPSTQQV